MIKEADPDLIPVYLNLPQELINFRGSLELKIDSSSTNLLRVWAYGESSGILSAATSFVWTNTVAPFILLEGVTNGVGQMELTYKLHSEDEASASEIEQRTLGRIVVDVNMIRAELIPDWNHDRTIDSADEHQVSASCTASAEIGQTSFTC